MTEHADVQLRVARVQDYDLATVANQGDDAETVQLLRFSLPDGTNSPWLALSTAQYANLLEEMRTRQQAALEHDFGV
jgi:hypothetical protein